MLGNEWKNALQFICAFCPERFTSEGQKRQERQEKVITWWQEGKNDAQSLGKVLKHLFVASKWAIIMSFAHTTHH